MTSRSFAVTWDYRCPFARNAHEHVITALEAGAPWSVTFVPFSLSQVHVAEGSTPVWDDEPAWPDLLALGAGVVVRDRYPAQFLGAHRALFAARHDERGDLRDRDVVRKALDSVALPAGDVLAEVEDGWPRLQIRNEHEEAVERHSVFGVPTFIVGEEAVFVRLMDRPEGDAERARSTIEDVLELATGQPVLNEFKRTTIPR